VELTGYQRWQWVTLFDPWPTWPISQLTRDPRDPWPASHDYSRVMTPDCCSFQSGPLSGSAFKIKHHHCHKIHRRNNWIKLTLWLKLCRKSLQCLKKTKSWVNGSRSVLTRDPRDPLILVDPLDPRPVTRWPIVISAGYIVASLQYARRSLAETRCSPGVRSSSAFATASTSATTSFSQRTAPSGDGRATTVGKLFTIAVRYSQAPL